MWENYFAKIATSELRTKHYVVGGDNLAKRPGFSVRCGT
jgi:hypothetical protein